MVEFREFEDDWEYQGWRIVTRATDLVWALHRETDPYGHEYEVMVEREGPGQQVMIRMHSKERALYTVSAASAPLEVVAEVMRRAGWTVTGPKESGT